MQLQALLLGKQLPQADTAAMHSRQPSRGQDSAPLCVSRRLLTEGGVCLARQPPVGTEDRLQLPAMEGDSARMLYVDVYIQGCGVVHRRHGGAGRQWALPRGRQWALPRRRASVVDR